mgnify:CR=1 FL=1
MRRSLDVPDSATNDIKIRNVKREMSKVHNSDLESMLELTIKDGQKRRAKRNKTSQMSIKRH